MAFELAEDAARENVRWIEVRYCPTLHRQDGLSAEAVVAAVRAGLRRAHEVHGVDSGQLICALRHDSPEVSLALARLACAHQGDLPGDVLGFDLAGPERDHPASAHAQAFASARAGNLWTTCHAGEDAGPDSIADAIRVCAVDRVGHGVALVRDPELFRYVADHRIGIEACLTSNLQTGAIPNLDAPPLPALLAAGPATFMAIALAGFLIAGAFLAYPPGLAKALIVLAEIPMVLTIALVLALLAAGPPAGEPER